MLSAVAQSETEFVHNMHAVALSVPVETMAPLAFKLLDTNRNDHIEAADIARFCLHGLEHDNHGRHKEIFTLSDADTMISKAVEYLQRRQRPEEAPLHGMLTEEHFLQVMQKCSDMLDQVSPVELIEFDRTAFELWKTFMRKIRANQATVGLCHLHTVA